VLTLTGDETLSVDFRRNCLLLDVDGTLLDIAPTPEAVVVPPGLVESLAALSTHFHGALGFVSGRTLEMLDALFEPLKLATVGCHGAEWRFAGSTEVHRLRELSEEVKKRVREIALVAPGVTLEDKGYTLAVHYRLAPEAGAAILRALLEQRAFFASQDLMILRGRAVLEIKPRWFNKATGMKHLMQSPPFAGRIPVFLGDDTTDEDIFRVLPDFEGVGIAVGRAIPGASRVFASPANVRRWLNELSG